MDVQKTGTEQLKSTQQMSGMQSKMRQIQTIQPEKKDTVEKEFM